MWETMADEIIAAGGEVRMNAPVEKLEVRDGRIEAVEAGGERIEPSDVISSLPLRATVGLAGAAADGEVQTAAQGLRYRDFLTVALVIDGEDLFPDNWIYIHDPRSASGGSRTTARGARGWSPTSPRRASASSTSASRATTCGRRTTTRSSSSARTSSRGSASSPPRRSSSGFVTRVPLAYPMYDAEYADRVDVIRGWLEGLDNLQQVGRNGLHRYNNSDHSMLTAIRAVDNVLTGAGHDLWAVNAESVYHEEDAKEEQPYRRVPETKGMRSRCASGRLSACTGASRGAPAGPRRPHFGPLFGPGTQGGRPSFALRRRLDECPMARFRRLALCLVSGGRNRTETSHRQRGPLAQGRDAEGFAVRRLRSRDGWAAVRLSGLGLRSVHGRFRERAAHPGRGHPLHGRRAAPSRGGPQCSATRPSGGSSGRPCASQAVSPPNID